ncbi:MAG: ribonuclease III [bacterium]
MRKSPIFSFLDEDILASDQIQKAITHRSMGKKNNERLEFLGDSVLNLAITEYLFNHLPGSDEGELSRMRSHLVKGTTLTEIALENNLGEHLRLGPGELKSGGFRRHSIMEDAVEAIIGAVFLLRGFEYTRDYILKVYATRLQNLPKQESLKDPKSRLQEFLQSLGENLPDYAVLEVTGEAHNQQFLCECRVVAFDLAMRASGSSRRKAEQQAANDMLEQLKARQAGKAGDGRATKKGSKPSSSRNSASTDSKKPNNED